jgi:hypothetical protein
VLFSIVPWTWRARLSEELTDESADKTPTAIALGEKKLSTNSVTTGPFFFGPLLNAAGCEGQNQTCSSNEEDAPIAKNAQWDGGDA